MDSILSIGSIEINFGPLFEFIGELGQSPLYAAWGLFKMGGWILIVFFILWILWQRYLGKKQEKYAEAQTHVLLAVDVPKNNEQSPMAVEHIFSHLAGAFSKYDFSDKLKGKFQQSFSLELVSNGGYMQFFIRTNSRYRDLVEASVYAQYPEAEIMEVGDYAETISPNFPENEFDLWGAEIILSKDFPYPIRTYPQFEHSLSAEFKDPMASLLENLSRLRPGEQAWLQIIITPIPQKPWQKEGEKVYKKLIGAKVKEKEGNLDKGLGFLWSVAYSFVAELFGDIEGGSKKEEKSEPTQLAHMSPGELNVVKAVQDKISKIGFDVKFRTVYIARKELFSAARGRSAIVGALNQFGSLDANRFKAKKMVGAKYVLKARRKAEKKNRFLKAYMDRDTSVGFPMYVLNIEELASVYHFPSMGVKAPLIKKTESRRAEPPTALPIEEEIPQVATAVEEIKEKEEEMLFNLPIEE